MAFHALDSEPTADTLDTIYKSMSLEDFMPAVESVLAKPMRSILISE